ncbi:3-oxoadipyl-CoA thiolase [Chromobacterium sphagni]|uniref:Beta-ketoadipyl-CoA thiolase n=1 Tax=Chromobacterium sphagni TaxID=1903179 RepID=A0ABX3CCZ0_9NEIS|nr:3-oxoadipyl-CoA thiolase [Chromobacterium sphagni]OHX20094.1 3-oxoadipyl-CoA thiolase [Chromobacterium sphagni]
MTDAFICDAVRTPIGRFGGALSGVRADDLAAIPLRALLERNPGLDPAAIDEVILGCANQAGEDNRNVARMSLLLAGYPETVPGLTVNRLCASGLDAVALAARGIKSGEAELLIAGGVESMSRAPFVMPKSEKAFGRDMQIYDTTIGWRFVNPAMESRYGVDTMPATAENVARDFNVSRQDQDAFALRSQQRYFAALETGFFASEVIPVPIPRRKQDPLIVDRDEHPRQTSLEELTKLKALFGPDSSITAGNASGVNDGAAAMIIASATAAQRHGLRPRARVVASASSGIAPRIMGAGPIEASLKALRKAGLRIEDIDVIELNEAFAAQALAVTRALGLQDDCARVNPNGGAIALGHPLGMSGSRLALTATAQLQATGGRYALCTMCVGVGQGLAIVLERV